MTFQQNQTGKPNLSPEAANSLGLGTVITPTMVPGLALSVDYYNITIAHAIGSITAQNTASCYGGPVANYSAAGGDGTDCLTGSSFLHPVDAHRPRTLQFALKLAF